LKKGSEINLIDKFDKTPLHEACMKGNVKMTELLVNNGADLNSVNKYGRRTFIYGQL